MKRHQLLNRSGVLIICLVFAACLNAAAATVPSRLTDEEFWKLSTSFSEQDGTFRSDNLLSNELNFQFVIPELLQTAKEGQV